jgi:hypothetical protein
VANYCTGGNRPKERECGYGFFPLPFVVTVLFIGNNGGLSMKSL